jgi:hypothetical protein
MESKLVNAYVDYVVVDNQARAIITFTFPHMSENTYVTLIHDKATNGTEPYILSRNAPALMLSAQYCEGIVINVWLGNDVVASGVYQVDTQHNDSILRSICDSGIQLTQEGKLSSEPDEDFEWTCQFPGD